MFTAGLVTVMNTTAATIANELEIAIRQAAGDLLHARRRNTNSASRIPSGAFWGFAITNRAAQMAQRTNCALETSPVRQISMLSPRSKRKKMQDAGSA